MRRLRKLAKIEDRPVSEIVRRAVDRDLEQRAAAIGPISSKPPVFPTFDGGMVQADAARMKEVIYGDVFK